jgi:cyclopropane-fatty-acyl-phospholipid synthase
MVGGCNGFARAYIAGEWRSPDVAAFFEWAACNAELRDTAFSGTGLSQLFDRLRHLRRANTQSGSRRNISAHYDLGNEFYSLWLDAGMNYSSGIFAHPGQSLQEAQRAKIARATELLGLKGREHVLEIGCGWGAMAEHLVSAHDCKVTGLTLSLEQRDFAVKRLDAAGAKARGLIRLQDYRDERVQYDRIVSIEMLEAVGEAFWPLFFGKLRSCLKPGGIAVVQSISIAESRFETYRRNPDFIQSYVFPGGMLPTIEIIRQQIAAAGLRLLSLETFGQSYALTLAAWRERFQQSWPRAMQLGFDERFKRMWEYYLAYCEAGFRVGLLEVGLYKIVHAGDA